MNGPRNLVFAVMFVILAAGFATASDIYIAQNAAGANTGADCADAHAASWFNSSANWGSVTGKIGPGTTVHLCGILSSTLTANSSGSSGSPITVLFESGAGISPSSCGSTGCLNLAGKSYIVVDGGTNGVIEATNSGTGLGNGDSNGVYCRSGCSHVEIKNLTINNMYVHSGAADNAPNNYYAIWIDGTNNLIHNNIIKDALAGIKVEAGSSGNQFYINTIHNINWGIFESAANSVNSITNEQIYGNEIYDFANWDTTADTFHHDGLFLSGNAAATDITHVDVYNNYVHGTSSSPVTCAPAPGNGSCMTAYIYINTDSYVRVFNNLLVANAGDPGPNNGWILMYVDDHDSLYNNTIIGGGISGPSNCVALNNGTNFSFKNNILSNCPTLLWTTGSPTFVSGGIDLNIYQNSSLTGAWRDGGNYYNTLANWRTAIGGESSSQAQTASLNLDSNYKPLPGSIAVMAAGNLSTLGIIALDNDKSGVARPGGSTSWDAGAYQDPPSNSGVLPPTGLSALVN